MSSTDEMAYRPVSSVRTMTKLVVLPAPETAKNTCRQQMHCHHKLGSMVRVAIVHTSVQHPHAFSPVMS